jgi:hypothetical protein
MARKPRTILEACTAARGIHRGAITAAHVAQWAMTTAELGYVPSTVEYSEWWGVDERTGWRHRAGIRDVFGEDWPVVVERVGQEIKRRSERSRSKVMGLVVHA